MSIIRWETPDESPRERKHEQWRPVADELRAAPFKWALILEARHSDANTLANAVKAGSGPFAPAKSFEAKIRTVTTGTGPTAIRVVRTYARYVGAGEE